MVKGEWNKQTAGGCKNFDTWANNPRFSLVMSKEETIVVVLSQSEKEKPHGIGFYVLENVESIKKYICVFIFVRFERIDN